MERVEDESVEPEDEQGDMTSIRICSVWEYCVGGKRDSLERVIQF